MRRYRRFLLLFALVLIALTTVWLVNRYARGPWRKVDQQAYRKSIRQIDTLRQEIDPANRKAAHDFFIKSIDSVLFPYWENTAWAFNGTSEKPGEGNIACGYFVTTMLRDAGVNLEREKLAQMASEQMIRTLVAPAFIRRDVGISFREFQDNMLRNGDQLYLVGLDNHTGFLLCKNRKLWFIHSGGQYNAHVQKVAADEAPQLINSRFRVTGCVSADPYFIDHWLGGKAF